MKDNKSAINLKRINRRLAFLNVFALASFFAVQMIITVTMGTKTQEISILRQQKNTLRLENEILLSEIDKAKSTFNKEDITKKYNLSNKGLIYLEEINPQNVAQN